ncbi:Homoserine kinase (HSK) (HK) [Candidatus Glomeribacter gigasporarum BEG34]|uniref:Homoserine kinase n=1 Tax=Candidatus Glomeribacter gigasporarum BEG34 TaxID=1070319 RepID=G2J9H1_9BURK|nr:homoserine kinase [Candidatus Glomeribacter gigasporarum]CCD29418.1 Homoserine kinase (HSK) (HK) [Candidatus Glomeribacter gigasporarum BEG34]
MAVFTALSATQLAPWLQRYPLGQIVDLQGIVSGIDNTNYFLTTTRGAYVLTIFEHLSARALPFYLDFMRHLAARRMPVPVPVAQSDGALFSLLRGKPAALVSRLEGAVQMAPAAHHCAEAGRMLARMHLAGKTFAAAAPQNPRGLAWQCEAARAIDPFLRPAQRRLLHHELAFQHSIQASAEYARLPAGICHGDLFRDNVFFVTQQGDSAGHPCRLSGFFDFYFAGLDKWLFDIAVCINDWCVMPASGQYEEARVRAFLTAYQAVRAFTPLEAVYWPALLRAAALRFWLSRLHDFYVPRPAKILNVHDPAYFERILRTFIAKRL